MSRTTRGRIHKILTNQQGVSGATFALSLVMLLGMAAITLDIGRAFVTKGELQNIADSAALAGARQLGEAYVTIAGANPTAQATNNVSISGYEGGIQTAADNMASQHAAGGKSNIALNAADTVIGQWNTGTKSVNAGLFSPDAVTIQVRRDSNTNGPIATFFAKVLPGQFNSLDVTATATAALGPAITAPPGALNAPFGISSQWFTNGGSCNDAIRFAPANDPLACAGWHSFDEAQLGSNPQHPAHCSSSSGPGGGGSGSGNAGTNASLMRNVLDCMTAGNYTSPEVEAGTTQFDFNNGEVANAFNNLNDLYNAEKDSSTGDWDIMVPIYQSSDCVGPTGPMTIVGFAKAVVHSVDVTNRIIDATVECHTIIPDARSGPPGSDLGGGLSPMGTIPGLVS